MLIFRSAIIPRDQTFSFWFQLMFELTQRGGGGGGGGGNPLARSSRVRGSGIENYFADFSRYREYFTAAGRARASNVIPREREYNFLSVDDYNTRERKCHKTPRWTRQKRERENRLKNRSHRRPFMIVQNRRILQASSM